MTVGSHAGSFPDTLLPEPQQVTPALIEAVEAVILGRLLDPLACRELPLATKSMHIDVASWGAHFPRKTLPQSPRSSLTSASATLSTVK
ncbi:hypothetical protein EIP91_004977 [Steccherinum ochraceum]|uniref:Uncharacterized protein n=1 Tax=Steccherinum ochraceum TaxID=92696 RepID=A0A4R0R8G3_9APHY|nr:hypothetical protein EIP91_004977 [Steccherinum ochraceum]